jgi:hypothetical protein
MPLKAPDSARARFGEGRARERVECRPFEAERQRRRGPIVGRDHKEIRDFAGRKHLGVGVIVFLKQLPDRWAGLAGRLRLENPVHYQSARAKRLPVQAP